MFNELKYFLRANGTDVKCIVCGVANSRMLDGKADGCSHSFLWRNQVGVTHALCSVQNQTQTMFNVLQIN